jgi:glycosyltransferase 2 family protein
MKRKLLFLLKVSVGASLLGLIIGHVGPGQIASALSEPAWAYVWLALTAQLLAKVVWALRWQVILAACGIRRSLWTLVGLVHIGLFFNNFLPSSFGGDAVRGYYTSSSRDDMAASYGALLVERLMGLVILALMCAVAAPVALATDADIPASIVLAAAAASVAFCAATAALFFWPVLTVPFQGLAQRFPKIGQLTHGVTAGWRVLRCSPSKLFAVVAASFALQVLAILFYVFCAWALLIDLPIVSYFVVVPIAVVAAMLPISLNGLGIREGVFVTMLHQQGVALAAASAFSVLALVLATLFSIAGGLLYMFWKPVRLAGVASATNTTVLMQGAGRGAGRER